MTLLCLVIAALCFLFCKSQAQSGSGGFVPEKMMLQAGSALLGVVSLVAAVVYFFIWVFS